MCITNHIFDTLIFFLYPCRQTVIVVTLPLCHELHKITPPSTGSQSQAQQTQTMAPLLLRRNQPNLELCSLRVRQQAGVELRHLDTDTVVLQTALQTSRVCWVQHLKVGGHQGKRPSYAVICSVVFCVGHLPIWGLRGKYL